MLIERKRGNSVLDKAVFTDPASAATAKKTNAVQNGIGRLRPLEGILDRLYALTLLTGSLLTIFARSSDEGASLPPRSISHEQPDHYAHHWRKI
ncbi:MAG TPA: hypothetical protein PK971_10985 [Saprospiraceae bacterium]|nr:hypothetical protein [Saprospiraceae bacterium]HND88845.1 hypothetical protein [Saprospiraceae bacterium]HNG90336.1 hypothetical protein [Saprospiraceae bacterium]